MSVFNFVRENKGKVLFISGSAMAFSVLLLKNSAEKNAKKIISTAQKYLGQKEINGNIGFEDPDFQRKMKNIGWYSGAEWCAYFIRLVVLEAFAGNPYKYEVLKRELSKYGSALGTWHNFKNHSGFWETSSIPSVGAIAVWKKPNSENSLYPYGKGHLEIVVNVFANGFYAIGGNTANKVQTVKHFIGDIYNGMNLIGFIKIK